MEAIIQSIVPGSIAEDLGIQPGDRLMAVNDAADLEDRFDYDFAVAGEAEVSLTIRHADGEDITYDIEKDPEDDLGLQFTSPIFTPIKTCNNACPFCFIDQQPPGLRASLYVKDDDYRLSYFCNTYITLTNLTRHDRERIARLRPGPLYVSVHSTVPAIRERLLLNTKAGNILEELRWLAGLDVPFHAQLVICPGINDGDSLTQTLQELASLGENCLSVAAVPVGLTHYRDQLPEMTAMTPEIAADVIDRVEAVQRAEGRADFAYASDEFYVRAGRSIPDYASYGDFPQLDDGVGTARMLTQEFFDLEDTIPERLPEPKRFLILTGQLGGMILQPIVQRLNLVEDLFVELMPIRNNFWGEAVTVAGLITGQDILSALKGQDWSGYTAILIPATMLKSGASVFLDDVTLAEVAAQAGCPVDVVDPPTEAQALLDAVFGPELLLA